MGGGVGLALIAGFRYWLLRSRPVQHENKSLSKNGGYHTELDPDAEKRCGSEMPNTDLLYEADGLQRNELDAESKQIWWPS